MGINNLNIGNGLNVKYNDTVTLIPTVNTLYILNGTTTVNLPIAANGNWIGFADHNGNFTSSPVTINRGGTDVFADNSTSIVLNTDFANVILGYANGVWSILSGAGI